MRVLAFIYSKRLEAFQATPDTMVKEDGTSNVDIHKELDSNP